MSVPQHATVGLGTSTRHTGTCLTLRPRVCCRVIPVSHEHVLLVSPPDSVWEQFGMCTGTFLGTGLFALPLIMAHVAVIESLALWLTLAGQLVTLASVAYFSQFLKSDESDRLL